MDTAEALLIIEQNRQTHAHLAKQDTAIAELSKKLESHAEEDRKSAALVAKHERYLATGVRAVKWATGTAVTALLGYLGLKT